MACPVRMHKAEKYAVRSSKVSEQDRTFFLKNFGCSRKVYNLYTDYLYSRLEEAGYEGGEPLPEIRLPEVTEFKRQYPYLKEADSLGLSNAKISFQNAVSHYNKECDHISYTKRALRRDRSGTEVLSFRGLKGMPKFHSRAMGDFSYTTNCQYPGGSSKLKQPTIRLEGSMLYLPKLKHGVELIVHRPLPKDATIGNVTVSMDADGTLYASIEYTYTVYMDMSLREAALSGDSSVLGGLKILGLDYSQPDFYIDSEGRKANCPHSYRKSEYRLAREQRKLSRMSKGSNNYERQLAKIRRIHAKIKNQRLDFIRDEAAYLAKSYDVIAVEDIDLRAMGGALSLGKNLHDNGFGMFRDILAQKLEAKGSVLVKVPRAFASTKTCSCCGSKNPEVVLGVSKWTCPSCGAFHMRDDNAAINIREEGRRILLEYFAGWLEEKAKAEARAAKLSDARKHKKQK